MTDTNHTLTIQLSGAEGAVIRALGLIERRGFRLGKCLVGEAGSGGRAMEVQVSSTRPGELLKRQLERLHDVFHVELKPSMATKQRTPGIRPVTRSTK
jgi:acetolactate synthase regulatory subunit